MKSNKETTRSNCYGASCGAGNWNRAVVRARSRGCCQHGCGRISLAPDAGEMREALALVDEQLEELIDSGLQVKQSDRPLAGALRDALATFCFQYADNVGRALRGEPLVSCLSGNPSSGFGGSPLRLRNLLRSIGKAASVAVWLVSVVATGILVNGASRQ